jgi:hypothetical protein
MIGPANIVADSKVPDMVISKVLARQYMIDDHALVPIAVPGAVEKGETVHLASLL